MRSTSPAISSTMMVEVVEAMIGLGPAKHRCPSRRIALEVEHFRHGLKDHRHRGQGGPGVRNGDNGDPPCSPSRHGFSANRPTPARLATGVATAGSRNSTWPRLSA